MGVKDLWGILSPVCEKIPLWKLQHKNVAIDLSAWICDSQNVKDSRQLNTYLRNLFFRTCYMLLIGVKVVFILEGSAPDLKHKVIQQRKAIHGKSNERTEYTSHRAVRSRLTSSQKQCVQLLKCMGVECYQSSGEAEALCGLLNEAGVVDGVISQDGDCFLYGAEVVYRNFNISTNGGGTVDAYEMSVITKRLNLGRNKLIALSMLCGCDYNDRGILGVGKESAIKFLSSVSNEDVLVRMNNWTKDPKVTLPYMNEKNAKLEESIKEKALKHPLFPFKDMQDEFLFYEQDISDVKLLWNKPDIEQFVLIAEQKLGWDAEYAQKKFLPILSRWHLVNEDIEPLSLDCIAKRRILRGVPSYEIKWVGFNDVVVEPEHLFQRKYAKEIDNFTLQKKAVKNKRKKTKRNADIAFSEQSSKLKSKDYGSIDKYLKSEDDLSSSIGNLSIMDEIEDAITPSDFECTVSDLLELSTIIESIVKPN